MMARHHNPFATCPACATRRVSTAPAEDVAPVNTSTGFLSAPNREDRRTTEVIRQIAEEQARGRAQVAATHNADLRAEHDRAVEAQREQARQSAREQQQRFVDAWAQDVRDFGETLLSGSWDEVFAIQHDFESPLPANVGWNLLLGPYRKTKLFPDHPVVEFNASYDGSDPEEEKLHSVAWARTGDLAWACMVQNLRAMGEFPASPMDLGKFPSGPLFGYIPRPETTAPHTNKSWEFLNRVHKGEFARAVAVRHTPPAPKPTLVQRLTGNKPEAVPVDEVMARYDDQRERAQQWDDPWGFLSAFTG